MDDEIIYVGTLPKQQIPKRTVSRPRKSPLSKAVPARASPLKPPVTEQEDDELLEVPQHSTPSMIPISAEEQTFMLATRHALEQALGKQALERHEVLLQQEKKRTEVYIAQLEEAAKQNNGIGFTTLSELEREQLAMMKVKVEGKDETIKTEVRLLGEWNSQLQEEKDKFEEKVEMMEKENSVLKAELQHSKTEKQGEKQKDYKAIRDELKLLRTRNVQLEEQKIELQSNMQLLEDECIALKTQISTIEHDNSVKAEKKNRLDDANSATPSTRNLNKRVRDMRRRNAILIEENKPLLARVAELEMQPQHNNDAESRAKQLQGETSGYEEVLGQKNAQILWLQDEIKDFKFEIEQLKGERSYYDGVVKEKEDQIVGLEMKVERLEEDMQQLLTESDSGGEEEDAEMEDEEEEDQDQDQDEGDEGDEEEEEEEEEEEDHLSRTSSHPASSSSPYQVKEYLDCVMQGPKAPIRKQFVCLQFGGSDRQRVPPRRFGRRK